MGTDTKAVQKRIDQAQHALVADGWTGVCEFAHRSTVKLSNSAALEAAYTRVVNYLSGPQDRTMDAARLRRRASIGSGLIEGTIKQLVSRRIKQNWCSMENRPHRADGGTNPPRARDRLGQVLVDRISANFEWGPLRQVQTMSILPHAWRIETHPDGLATLWFNRPGSSQNSLDGPTLDELDERVTEIEQWSGGLRGLIVRSSKPKGFCAGADLKAIRNCQRDQEVEVLLRKGRRAFTHLSELTIPTVALVHGTCLGGGLELAMSCDSIIAINLPHTQLGLPEIKLGLIPGWGGIGRICRRVGLERGIQMLLTAKLMNAQESLTSGLADGIASGDIELCDFFPPVSRNLDWPPRSIDLLHLHEFGEGAASHAIGLVLEQNLNSNTPGSEELAIQYLVKLAVSKEAREAIDVLFAKVPVQSIQGALRDPSL